MKGIDGLGDRLDPLNHKLDCLSREHVWDTTKGRLQARMENDHRLVLIGRILPQLGPQLGPGFTRSPRRKAKNAPGFMGLFYVPAFSTNSSVLS